ncbi:MAG: SIMPL domain-containing protein [Paracoccaceae bacterium]
MRILMAMLAFGFWSTQVFATDPVMTGPAKVVVNGVGEIVVGPDFAILTLGVTHEANTAVKAMKSVSADMTAIMKTLQKESIAERDIQTARVQVQLNNNRSQFRASNQVKVRVRDLPKLGRILGQTIADGANQVGGWSSGVRFDVSDREQYKAATRKIAVQNAMSKAKDLAEAAGASIGNIIEIKEGSGGGGLRVSGAARIGLCTDVPVAEGEVTIRSRVEMVFELLQ